VTRDAFPGERPEHRMRKLLTSNPRVTCASCRQFDGSAWCRRWNYHTAPDAPICDQYRPNQAWTGNVSRYSRGE
jgi:hypothetical protein